MGQYYIPCILNEQNEPIFSMYSHEYDNGLKLMEHSYIGNVFVETFEHELSINGKYHKSKVVWAGDYANNEPESEINLYELSKSVTHRIPTKSTTDFDFIVNHSKKEFVSKRNLPVMKYGDENFYIHPLPILTSEGNGRGGGDFRPNNETHEKYVGSWARDVISVENSEPVGYTEIKPNFYEKW